MTTYLHDPKNTTAIWWLLPETQAEVHLFIQQTVREYLLSDRQAFSWLLKIHCRIRKGLCSQNIYI